MTPVSASTRCPGPVDVLYFPSPRPHTPARSQNPHVSRERRCHEPVQRAAELARDAGVCRVLVSQCKQWSCERRWMCVDTQLEDVLRYTFAFPDQFTGVAGYSPMDIAASLREAEIGVMNYGFCGMHVHPGSFGVGVKDRRMYPLYSQAVNWRVPVMLDLRPLPGNVPFSSPAELLHAMEDFPDMMVLIVHAPWPPAILLSVAESQPNARFAFGAQALMNARIREFVASEPGQDCSLWGSNGMGWKDALAHVARLELSDEVKRKLLEGNAKRMFALERPALARDLDLAPANPVLTAE